MVPFSPFSPGRELGSGLSFSIALATRLRASIWCSFFSLCEVERHSEMEQRTKAVKWYS